MWPRFNRQDVRIIAHYLGMLMIVFGAIMVLPLAVSIMYGEWAVSCRYILGIGIALTLGALSRLAKVEPRRMGRIHAIAITGMVWIVGAVIAAVPLFLSGHYATFLDAVFEGVSGLTATGLSLVQDIDHMSMADNMWRFVLQFVGGQGVVVVALSLGIFIRSGNALYNSEAREESVMPNIKNTARFILQFSTAAVAIGTVIITIVLVVIGMEPFRGFFHALWLSIGAYDTGGFAPGSLSLIAYHSWPLEIILIPFMMLGALSFALVAQVNKGNWGEFVHDIEVRTLALWITSMVIIFVATLTVGNFLTDYFGLVRRGVFTIISATTNTGFQVLSTAQITTLFSSGAFLLVAVAMAVGGSSASTAGGIKAMRVGLIFKGIGLYIKRVLQPRSAVITSHYNHIGRHQLTPTLLSSALLIASLYVVSYIVGALVGIAYGYEALHAMFESISAASNAGLTSGVVQAGMPIPLEILYILQMWLGRLEFITLLALFASLIASFIPRKKVRPEGPQKARELNSDGRSSEMRTSKESSTSGTASTILAVVLAAILAVSLMFMPLQSVFAAESVSPETDTSHTGSVSIDEETIEPEDVSDGDVTISELAAVPEYLDYTIVEFQGEVIGDRIYAGADHIWITMSDGSSAMSVLLPREYEDQIAHFGNYVHNGTVLRVSGEYHLSCSDHEGSNDVHATTIISVLDEGKPRAHPVNLFYLAAGVVLIGVAGGLIVFYSVLSKKRR